MSVDIASFFVGCTIKKVTAGWGCDYRERGEVFLLCCSRSGCLTVATGYTGVSAAIVIAAVFAGFRHFALHASTVGAEVVVFEELHVLLGGKVLLEFGCLFGASLADFLFVGYLAVLLVGLACFGISLALSLAFGLQGFELGLLFGREIEAFEGVGQVCLLFGAFELAVFSVGLVAFGGGRLLCECRGCYDGAEAEGCYNKFLVHEIFSFRLYIDCFCRFS